MSDIIDNLRTAQKKAEASGNPKAASFVGHQVSLKPKKDINNCFGAIFLIKMFLAIYKILIQNYFRTLLSLFSVGEGSSGS